MLDPLGVDEHPRGLDAEQLERHLGDHPGQPERPGGRPEDLRLVLGGGDDRLFWRPERERPHMVDEAALDVMVLAVDVGCHRPADRHEPRPGGHRDEEALRHELPHERVEARAGLDGERRRGPVDRLHGGEAGRVDDRSTGVLGRVAVAAPEAPSDHASAPGLGDQPVQPRRGLGRHQLRRAGGGPAPAGEDGGHQVASNCPRARRTRDRHGGGATGASRSSMRSAAAIDPG